MHSPAIYLSKLAQDAVTKVGKSGDCDEGVCLVQFTCGLFYVKTAVAMHRTS